MSQQTKSKTQKGASMIEVLVSMAIFAIGLLGTASMQITGLKQSSFADYRSQANILGYDILERMRANKPDIQSYQIGLGQPTPTLNPTDIHSVDLNEWRAAIAQNLPQGQGGISLANNQISVTIQWRENAAANTPGSSTQNITLNADLP